MFMGHLWQLKRARWQQDMSLCTFDVHFDFTITYYFTLLFVRNGYSQVIKGLGSAEMCGRTGSKCRASRNL
jgi:hypothetical protein